MTRLNTLLCTDHFPHAELQAMQLDGQVYFVDGCGVSIDVPHTAELRASALRAILPHRLIAELTSAAWVWGALDRAPWRHSVCTDAQARVRPSGTVPLTIREVVLDPQDVTTVAGLSVTTPLRTVVDLARFTDDWSDDHASVASRLMAIGSLTMDDCVVALDRRRNLPRKLVALQRLGASVSPN